jgi:hypothetical protein
MKKILRIGKGVKVRGAKVKELRDHCLNGMDENMKAVRPFAQDIFWGS